MKMMLVAIMLVACGAETVNPIEKVIQMLGDLKTQVISEGHDSQAIYEEKCAWCEETSRDLLYQIKEGKREAKDLTAEITKLEADISNLAAKIDELVVKIATAAKDLEEAKKVRAEDNAAFKTNEKELVEVLDKLGRAIGILQKEAAGGAALIQESDVEGLTSALSVLVDAAAISYSDADALTSLLQSGGAGAPDPEAYENHSGGIIQVLQNIEGKANAALQKARKEEMTSLHKYEMLAQSLSDTLKYGDDDKKQAEADTAARQEAKATAEGKLNEVKKLLASNQQELTETRHECLDAANTHEQETASRSEEVEVIKKAIEIIQESTGGSAKQVYDFLQTSSEGNVLNFVRNLGKTDPALAQLASRISSAMHLSSDPFVKVRGLIQEMLDRLEKEAADAADKKAYCDKNLAENNAKMAKITGVVNKLNSRIDKASADHTAAGNKLKEIAKSLAALAKATAEMNKVREEEKAAYEKNQPELAAGLEGIEKALTLLKDYYAAEDKGHDKNSDAASGIIALLEVAQSDTAKLLNEVETDEKAAAAEFEKQTKENEIRKAQLEADSKYTKKELKRLDAKLIELNKDLDAETEQQNAVQATLDALKAECEVKVESYADRKAAREREIAGLKEALNILENV